MRFSQFFIHTLKEAPKDVQLKSHEYLIRGGFVQQVGSGIYHLLPLGKRVLDKIQSIIKAEMNKSGAIELSLGFITPASLWKKSERFDRYGLELLSFKDRKNNDFVLGPTHEEAITELVKSRIKSYKQLPLHLYQINLKFRDEIRPRFGLLRAREFIMKDGYSFHANKQDLKREFDCMEQTYCQIFQRLGLDFRCVEADSGAIGGSGSKEFMILAQSGEDTICVCHSCSYGANLEAAIRKKKAPPSPPPKADFAKFHTPNTSSIEQVASFFKVDLFFTLKAIVQKAIFKDHQELVFFFIRGSDKLNPTKALNAIQGALELTQASDEELKQKGLFPGYIGPYALRHLTQSEHIYFDQELCDESNLICGANEEHFHFVGVNLMEFEGLVYKDLIEIEEHDSCAFCEHGKLYLTKGIEVGHIFQLGNQYSSKLEANFLDANGLAKPFEMGCYGIGVSRLLGAIIEQNHDQKGIKWTKTTAPFMVHIILSNPNDDEQNQITNTLTQILDKAQIDYLIDDRNERFGKKMADFELIGLPYAIILGKQLQEGNIELITRANLQKQSLPKHDLHALSQKISCH